MELTLTPELEAEIQEQLATGRFESPADVLKSALGLLRAEDECILSLRETLDAKLELSFAAAERGDTISGEELEAELDTWRAGVLCRNIA